MVYVLKGILMELVENVFIFFNMNKGIKSMLKINSVLFYHRQWHRQNTPPPPQKKKKNRKTNKNTKKKNDITKSQSVSCLSYTASGYLKDCKVVCIGTWYS